MKFKKDSTVTLQKNAVAQVSNIKRANSLSTAILMAANKNLKTKKPVFVVSNYTGWYVVAKIGLIGTINGYIEVDNFVATKYIPLCE